MASDDRHSRPKTSYGRRGSAQGTKSLRQEEKMPKHVEKIVEKKIVSEYNFNRHVKDHAHLRRIKSDKRPSRHHGDENLTDEDLTQSMPERMMRLTVGDELSPLSRSGSNSPMRRSFERDLHHIGDVSPVLIRSHTIGNAQTRRGSKAEISNAKLAMMKKKLSPLPSRHPITSIPSTEDLSPGPSTPH